MLTVGRGGGLRSKSRTSLFFPLMDSFIVEQQILFRISFLSL